MKPKLLLILAGALYDLIVISLLPFLFLSSFFSKKIKGYLQARGSVFQLLKKLKNKEQVFFYCSSIGEFEQALPLIKHLSLQGEKPFIFFHSLNGFTYARNNHNSIISLTPIDLFTVWLIFFSIAKPKFTVINRHEFWPGFVLASLFHSPLYVINAVDAQKSFFRSLIPSLVFKMSKKVFYANPVKRPSINKIESGDTRLDRLIERKAEQKAEIDLIQSLKSYSDKNHLVIGNAYPADFKLLTEAVSQKPELLNSWNFLIIPSRPENKLSNRFSKEINSIEEIASDSKKIKVFPVFGKLFQLYALADLAWVGGGLCCGIHNTLEPYFYNIPIISGPFLNQQPDAILLKELKVLQLISSPSDLIVVLENFNNIRIPDFQGSTSPTDIVLKNILNNE